MVEDIKIVQVKIDDLKPSEYNPRQANEKECLDLKNSIERFGLVDPIIVNSNPKRKNIIIGGHFRCRMATELGYQEVPVVYINISDLDKERELNVRLNKNSGSFDYDLLANFDEDVLKDIGFDSKELDKIFQLDTKPEDDEVPEARTTNIKLGDLFKLGEHRLLCGDSTQRSDVERLMAGEKADMVFTDPPYGINYKDLKGRFEAIKNDQSLDSIESVIRFIGEMAIPAYVCCNWKSYPNFYAILKDLIKSVIVWDKESRIQNLDKFYKQHEFICYVGKLGGEKTVDGDVWRCQRETRKDHPTAKPVELCERAIRHSSEWDSIVLDLFGGSGSTLIACEKLNRKCRMMEIDPIYCQVIIDRWEKFTNGRADRITGE